MKTVHLQITKDVSLPEIVIKEMYYQQARKQINCIKIAKAHLRNTGTEALIPVCS